MSRSKARRKPMDIYEEAGFGTREERFAVRKSGRAMPIQPLPKPPESVDYDYPTKNDRNNIRVVAAHPAHLDPFDPAYTYAPPVSRMEQAIASQKSYVTAAVITLFSYSAFGLPGFIFNILYIRDARRNEMIAGHALPGVGCLQVMLILMTIVFLLSVVVLGLFFAGMCNALAAL